MMRTPCIAAALLIAATAPAHAVFKCVSGGKTVYSQEPCSPDAQQIDLTPPRGYPPASPVPGNRSADAQRVLADMEKSRRLRNIDLDIQTAERQIFRLRTELSADLDRMSERQRRAANNLAGATLEGSISAEKQAAMTRFQTEIGIEQSKIDALRAERAALTSAPTPP